MQTTHQERARIFRNEIQQAIFQKIGATGVKSNVNNNICLKVSPSFDSDSIGHSIAEVQHDQIIDERGLYFSYECLSIDELVELADLIKA